MMMRVGIVLLAFWAAGLARADEPSSESLGLARQLIDVLGIKDQIIETTRGCVASTRGTNLDPVHLLEQDPNAFQGITPASPLWAEIESAYRGFVERSCHSGNLGERLDVVAKTYSEGLSAAELKSTIAFHSSPTGRAFKRVKAAAFQNSRSVTQQKLAEKLEQSGARLTKQLKSVVERFLSEPIEQDRPSDLTYRMSESSLMVASGTSR